MSGNEKEYKLTVVGGDRYPSLEALQAELAEPLTRAVTAMIKEMLAQGEVIIRDGKWIYTGREDGA